MTVFHEPNDLFNAVVSLLHTRLWEIMVCFTRMEQLSAFLVSSAQTHLLLHWSLKVEPGSKMNTGQPSNVNKNKRLVQSSDTGVIWKHSSTWSVGSFKNIRTSCVITLCWTSTVEGCEIRQTHLFWFVDQTGGNLHFTWVWKLTAFLWPVKVHLPFTYWEVECDGRETRSKVLLDETSQPSKALHYMRSTNASRSTEGRFHKSEPDLKTSPDPRQLHSTFTSHRKIFILIAAVH